MELEHTRRIWVRCPNWVGDMVMAMPFLSALRQSAPRAAITLGGRAALAAVPAGSDVFDAFTPVGRNLLETVRQVHAGRFDMAVLLPRSLRTAAEAWLARVPVRAGFSDQGRSFLLTHAVAPVREGHRIRPAYGVDTYLALAEALGLTIPSREICLRETPEGTRLASALLEEGGRPLPRPWILFIPGAAFGSAKCWPPQYFTALGKTLLARYGGTILALGGPGEEEDLRRIAGEIGRGAFAYGPREAPLSVLKSLMARADGVVTNDTGPRHIAVAFGTPGVVFAGPMDPRYSQGPQGRLRILREEVPCSPCDLPQCPTDHRCLARITPERTLAVLASFLG